MSRINAIQNAIKELDGGSFQKLFDAYLYKKYKFQNIQTLGVQTGTNKTTKGTPDSFVVNEDRKYTLIMYGTVGKASFDKMKKDILSCFNKDKMELPKNKIKKIICAYSSTNIHVEQLEELKNIINDIDMEMIGLSTISHDLLVNFPFLAADHLNIPVDTNQIFSIEEFIKAYDKNGMNAPLDIKFIGRKQESDQLYSSVSDSQFILVTGNSGVGKTKLVLEACNQFKEEGWNVLCVKNNGEILYNDIKYYISEKGKYLLFIDDANQTTSLEYILNYIVDASEEISIKIVMTVRDYAKHRVKGLICKYTLPLEVEIKPLKSEEVKQILKENLGINNRDFLDRIAKITKGNIRLAILAGKNSIEKGSVAIENATDIFANYYGEIIKSSKLEEKFINALFVISLLGTVRFKESTIALQILELVGINAEHFIDLCHDLNEKELIDLYQDEVVKISDQSFGNYMLEYILIEKQTISISQLLQIGFPQFKNKLVFALNTIVSLFYSEKVNNYIENQVNESWNLAEQEIQIEYLKCFHALNQEKSLSILKRSIEEMDTINEDLTKFDFEGEKNYNAIATDEINILSEFKYSKYYTDALELMLIFFNKRSDLAIEFYFAFSDRLSYDVHSYELEYEKEFELLVHMWNYSKDGSNINATILMLHVLKEMLKCSFSKSESGETARTLNIITFDIVLSTGCEKLRLFIWGILSKLYSNNTYIELIEDILSSGYTSGLNENEAKKIAIFDLKCIKELFFDKWINLTFDQCKVLSDIKKHFKWLGINNDDFFKRYTINRDFMLYNTLIKEHMKGRTWQEDEAERRKEIESLISKFEEDDYVRMFNICKSREKKKDREDWSIQSGISVIFSILENNSIKYFNVVRAFLKCGAPYGHYSVAIIGFLIKEHGFESTQNLIAEFNFDYKRNWMCTFWEVTPQESINSANTNKFLEFINTESVLENPHFPKAIYLDKYRKIKPDIIKEVSEIIIQVSEKKAYLAAEFLDRSMDEEQIEALLNIFENDINLLEELYLLAMGNHFDYEGKLLEKLIKENIPFWSKFTVRLAKDISRTSYEHNVFDKVWSDNKYKELISIACENMIGKRFGFMSENVITAIFANSEKITERTGERKKLWIKEYIRYNINNDIEKIRMIFGVIVTIFPEDKIEYIIELLKCSNDIELFKKLPLFPSSSSWSGSEVPLIDKQIDFLSKLLVSLKGVDLIEHRAYVKERKDAYEKYKQGVLIKEYLEDGDIA